MFGCFEGRGCYGWSSFAGKEACGWSFYGGLGWDWDWRSGCLGGSGTRKHKAAVKLGASEDKASEEVDYLRCYELCPMSEAGCDWDLVL